MFKKTFRYFIVVCWLLIAPNMAWAFCSGGCDCCRCPNGPAQCLGSHSSCEAACGLVSEGSSSSSSSNTGRDYEAEHRAQEQAEAARRAEEERQAELERQRREAENKRRIEEAERQAKFLEDRDAAAGTLRGSTGTSVSSSGGLRGSTVTSGSTGLRGSSADSGLRGLRTGTTVTPNADPMVVDTRNVPSGLPKSVDDAIPHTPAGDRVRKGFQAIQAGDWKVALAWFQDAHNKEPGDPGIARLVDLAQFTLDYRTRAQTLAAKKNSTPVRSAQSADQKSAIKSTGGAEAKSGDDSVASAAASQMAARARADAAFKKYVEKYGDQDATGRAIAVSKAARGEGYTNEELKAQLQQALKDYRKNYRKNHPNGSDKGVGDSPTADEIVLGEKG